MAKQLGISRPLSRRDFLRLGGSGALLALLSGSGLTRLVEPARAAPAASPAAYTPLSRVDLRLVATDGFISLPGRRLADNNGLYVFGFRSVEPAEQFVGPEELIAKYKGRVQHPSPIIGVDKDVDFYLTMTNLGLEGRPDLDDAHTVHWHGFRNPNAVFDGVPEVSISVPPARSFPYFYRTRVEGTYMYHCHFEDSEHVQMGMDGVVYIKSLGGGAYDGDGGTTAFSREFTFMLNEIDTTPHDNLIAVQEFVWSDYKPNYWVINGRSFPDTIIRDQELSATDFDMGSYTPPGGGPAQPLGYTQPVSSLVQVEEGETALLRFANLGYEQHTMQLLGIPMRVVGHDATFLGGNAYSTHSIYIGPGESRDVLFTAPPYSALLPGGVDGGGRNYNLYWLRNRNAQRLVNGSLPGPGGMMTQVWVYPAGTLGPQPGPNRTI